ncbi:MAG TPA: HAD hydrolase family protein [Chthoniobacterales bacterium]|jgi:hydroxymethylpyrimidine pyrophosphatase-like HAD family hydrolase
MATDLRLISTDFDGTLIQPHFDGRCQPAFAAALADFKAAGGHWAINTGRSLEHIIEGVTLFAAPFEPDYVLTHEREIWHRDSDGVWRDYGDWNRICRERHAALFQQAKDIFRRVREVLAGAHDVNLIEENGVPSGLITADEAAMDRVAALLDSLRGEVPDFHYQRNTIYLRFCHAAYDKGTALAELCRIAGFAREEVFASGDHYNDLPMLDGRFAAHVACPANAIPEVKSAVLAAGGAVASASFGDGTAEALVAVRREISQKKPAAVS